MAFDDHIREKRLVEVQQTFYDPPREATMRGWRALARSGFDLAIKARHLVTHDGSSPTYRRFRTPLGDADRATGSRSAATQLTTESDQAALRARP